MNHDSVLRLSDRPTFEGGDVECTADSCRAPIDPSAPAPLCASHLRQVFAYVLGLAEHVSDSPALSQGSLMHTLEQGWVYFIRKGGLVKIGFTTHRARRFRELRPDAILGSVKGTTLDERRCHTAFAHLRVEGEWFRQEPELLDFIRDLVA